MNTYGQTDRPTGWQTKKYLLESHARMRMTFGVRQLHLQGLCCVPYTCTTIHWVILKLMDSIIQIFYPQLKTKADTQHICAFQERPPIFHNRTCPTLIPHVYPMNYALWPRMIESWLKWLSIKIIRKWLISISEQPEERIWCTPLGLKVLQVLFKK